MECVEKSSIPHGLLRVSHLPNWFNFFFPFCHEILHFEKAGSCFVPSVHGQYFPWLPITRVGEKKLRRCMKESRAAFFTLHVSACSAALGMADQ